jgi:type IV pilus assembly protein PilC
MPLIVTPGQLVHRADLYHQLSQLVSSGIGLIQALQIQQRSPPSRSFRQPLGQLVQSLLHGETFGEAVERIPQWIPAFDAALLQAAEKSGRLPATFALLSEHYRERARLVRQLLAFCAYPFFVLNLAALIFPITSLQGLVLKGQVGGFLMQKLTVLGPLYLVLLLVVTAGQGTRGATWRGWIEALLRCVPILGKARRSLALSRLSAALEALISSGTTLIESWELAAAASGSPALQRAVRAFKPELLAGETPAEAVSRCREFPSTFANQYASGEVSGKLDETLRWLQQHYSEEGSRRLRYAIIVGAGLLFFAVALLVAWQVISFWIGYFNQINEFMPK